MAPSDKQNLNTSKGHQWLALIGATFVVFGIVFISFYSNNFWFSLNLSWWGIPAIFVAGVVSYGLLILFEGTFGCRLWAPILRGKPPVVYRKWLAIDDAGFCFGMRHITWNAIDEIALTFFGNLEIKSRIVCGAEQAKPDVLFKFPFSVATQETQKVFIDALKLHRQSVVMNTRLEKRLNSPIVKGQNLIQASGALMMFVMLLDLGYSSFFYLEMLKHYYLADLHGLAGEAKDAASELALGDEMRAHPLPVSYITHRVLEVGQPAAGKSEARAEALWHMGRHADAIAEARTAVDKTPNNYRSYLYLARLLEEDGKYDDAKAQVQKAIDKHKDSLLPRLYLIADAMDQKKELAKTMYKQSMDDLNDKVFQDEPYWPPGGNCFLMDNYYSRDIYFILDRLLDAKLEPKAKPAK